MLTRYLDKNQFAIDQNGNIVMFTGDVSKDNTNIQVANLNKGKLETVGTEKTVFIPITSIKVEIQLAE